MSAKLATKLIPLPAASATQNGLTINQRATDKEMSDLGHALAQIEGSRQWWLGDYGVEIQRRKMKEAKALNPGIAEEDMRAAGRHYMGERADILGIDAGSWHNCVMVARYYELSFRNETSFGHHYIAMLAAGGAGSDPKKAIAWLLKANEKGWSVAQLRREVNLSLGTAPIPQASAEANLFAPLDGADHWAATQNETRFTPELAKACLVRFTALIAFVDRLRAVAAQSDAGADR